MQFILSLVLSSLLGLATASPLLPPTQDPFYTTPPDFETAAPGTILRMRHAPGNLTAVTNSSAAFHVLYRTTDSRLQPSWAVTTVLVPKFTNGTALLSYQVPYNSVSLDASPSYALYTTPLPELQVALERGWFVSVPDHESHLAAFTAERGQGFATLDSVRAVLSTDVGLRAGARYAMIGFSGGSLATEWAVELQPLYAPDLSFAGAALGGLPANLTDAMHRVAGTQYAGLIALSTIGLTRPYPGAFDLLKSQLIPGKRARFLEALDMDVATAFEHFFEEDIWDVYFIDGRAYLERPDVQAMVDDNWFISYHGTPQTPLFMYHALHDELASAQLLEDVVERYCRAHVDIQLELNEEGGHIDEMTNGSPRAFDWLQGVLNGREVTRGCVTKRVNIDLSS